jgi:hypothetical protein
MLITEMYNGQGLGNQLWCYVVTKTIALDNNYEFGIQSPHKFKGNDLFPNTQNDFKNKLTGGNGPEGGPPLTLPNDIEYYYKEKRINHPKYDCDISPLDPIMQKIPDNSKIDGTMQAEDYILHRRDEIKSWLQINPKYNIKDFADDNICVINFRGTWEYISQPAVFLPKQYFINAMNYMRNTINKDIKFIIITDDISTAKQYFSDLPVYHISKEWDYGVVTNASYLIISNSSFPWFAAWTSNNNKLTIAPKYWARHNISDGFWSNGDSLTRNWIWLDRDNNFQSYEECLKEKIQYLQDNNYVNNQ